MNIYQMAKKAGCSVATVSRALSPRTRPKVAAATLANIDTLVRKYSYAPNLAARNLRLTFYGTIGVIIPFFRGLFFTEYYQKILAGVSDAVLDTDLRYKILVQREGLYMDRINLKSTENVDALIIAYWPYYYSSKKILSELPLPNVVIAEPDKKIKTYFACCDNWEAGRMAAEYLYQRGHRHMTVLSGPLWWGESVARLAGFRDYMQQVGGWKNVHVAECDFSEKTAFDITGTMLSERRETTAFFCMNDYMAFGVIRKLQQLGMRCPEDVSVMGFDDSFKAEFFDPPLTTFYAPVYDFSKAAAVRLAVHLVSDKKDQPLIGKTILPVTIKERLSVGEVRRSSTRRGLSEKRRV